MCEDTAGYVAGYGCSSYIGYDCLNEALFTEEFGYSLEDWLDIVESCPESCGLCESIGETWSVPSLFLFFLTTVVPSPFLFPVGYCPAGSSAVNRCPAGNAHLQLVSGKRVLLLVDVLRLDFIMSLGYG